MIVLGFGPPSATAPDPCRKAEAEGCSLLLVSQTLGHNARARLDMQLRCHRALPAFVPLCPSMVHDDACVRNWLRDHTDRVLTALHDLRGMTQMTLHFQYSEPAPAHTPADGADWLRARADQVAANATRQQALLDHLETLCGRIQPRRHVLKVTPNGVLLHVLETTDSVAQTQRYWVDLLSQPAPATAVWRVTMAAGWPPSAFWDGASQTGEQAA